MFLSVRDTAATRGQYLALSKAYDLVTSITTSNNTGARRSQLLR